MKTCTVIAKPVFQLKGWSYNTAPSTRNIYPCDLQVASVGDNIKDQGSGSTARNSHHERLTVVYKDDNGCACLFRRWGTTDAPIPELWEDEPELIWFEHV